MRTAAVVVAWRRPAMTAQALTSLAAMDQRPDHLVCVAQEFDTADRATYRAQAPTSVDTVFSDTNDGFAAGVNRGMDLALAGGADWILLLNNDAVVEPSCLGRCLDEAVAQVGVAAVAPTVMFMDDPDRVWWAGGTLSQRWGITRHPGVGGPVDRPASAAADTEFIPGCCVLYSAEAWQDLGGFREDFFLYYEDADWCLRARAAGWRLRHVGEPLCLHAVGVSSDQRGDLGLSANTAYYIARNQLRAALDTPDVGRRVTRLLGYGVVWTGYNATRIARSRHPGVARAYGRGVRDGLANRLGPDGGSVAAPRGGGRKGGRHQTA